MFAIGRCFAVSHCYDREDVGAAIEETAYQVVHRMKGGPKALGSSDEGPLPPTEMERASANAEELHRMGPGFKSKWAHQMISTLQEAVPSAMSLRDDLRFLLKFKRDRSGVPLKLPVLMEVSDLAEAQAAEIADLVGSCRTLGRRS
jgi:hypothetical protein